MSMHGQRHQSLQIDIFAYCGQLQQVSVERVAFIFSGRRRVVPLID